MASKAELDISDPLLDICETRDTVLEIAQRHPSFQPDANLKGNKCKVFMNLIQIPIAI